MSFIPAVPDFRNSSLLTPAGSPSIHLGAMIDHLSDKGTIALIQTHVSPSTKFVKQQLPRARKARVRLRQQNRLRAAVRNN